MAEQSPKNGNPRIAYILKRYPRLSETFIANEILSLSNMGFDIRIFSIKDPGDRIHSFVREITSPVHYLPAVSKENRLEFFVAHLYTFIRNPVGYVRCLAYARKHSSPESRKKFLLAGYVGRSVISGRIQHLHSHFATGSTRLAKYIHIMTGVPYSFTAHAKDIFSDRVSPKQLKRRIKKAQFIVTISEYNRNYLKNIVPTARIHVIRNGLRIEEFSPNGRFSGGESRPVILGVGRLVEKKGFVYLVEACGVLKREGKDFRCIIVGDGPLKEEIEGRITELGLSEHVRLEGSRIQDELIRDYYTKAHILVLPCTVAANNDMDGIPVVLEEAMAMRIPVVTTAVAGIPELVRHRETGLLVPPGDVGELARSIRNLMEDEPLRQNLKSSGRNLIESEYDIEKTSSQLAGLFKDALGEH